MFIAKIDNKDETQQLTTLVCPCNDVIAINTDTHFIDSRQGNDVTGVPL